MDPLQHFLDAQAPTYDTALSELRAGRKRTHWMWFIFPQLAGLGTSPRAQRFAIPSLRIMHTEEMHDGILAGALPQGHLRVGFTPRDGGGQPQVLTKLRVRTRRDEALGMFGEAVALGIPGGLRYDT